MSLSSMVGSNTAGVIFHRALSEAPDLFAEIAADRLTQRKDRVRPQLVEEVRCSRPV